MIIHDVNFLNNADLDGKALPPAGAPNIMMAAGGRQLDNVLEDGLINVWQFHVDWKDPSRTTVTGPTPIAVAPYHYLCGGQLTYCVPQPGSELRLDAQGDKIMARLVYRRVNGHESIVAVHSVDTSSGGGGVRWYEFRVDADQRLNRRVSLHQQGTYAPGGSTAGSRARRSTSSATSGSATRSVAPRTSRANDLPAADLETRPAGSD